MVLLNYELFIRQKLREELETLGCSDIAKTCALPNFLKLLIQLYEYCEEINIIEQRMRILAEETESMKGIKPKLLDSQIAKAKQKTKQISAIYTKKTQSAQYIESVK